MPDGAAPPGQAGTVWMFGVTQVAQPLARCPTADWLIAGARPAGPPAALTAGSAGGAVCLSGRPLPLLNTVNLAIDRRAAAINN